MENKTERRKIEHIEKALDDESAYNKTTLFEYVDFIHNALPEMDFNDVDVKTTFLGKTIGAPIMAIGMTGGFRKAGEINRGIAKVCEKYGIPMGVGSQRAMIENPSLKDTYNVKDTSDVILVGNIGAYQIKEYSNDDIDSLVKSIDADALAIHLNPLQEIIQPEGDKDFRGVLNRIAELVDYLDVPIIVKEVGTGISDDVAKRLSDVGIKWIDASGSGGTSWGKVEYLRGGKPSGFEEWGIPTALSILMVKRYANVIASGGIRNGIDGAKSIALGARLFGAASPILKAYFNNSLDELIGLWIEQLKVVMFLTGSKSLDELKNHIFIYGKLREIALDRGLI